MAPHSSTLAWNIPWMEEPGGLQSMGLLRVGHDWVTSLSHFHFSLSCIGEGNGNPLHCSCLENPRDGGAWWAAVSGVAQSRTRLKQLSSSSSSSNAHTQIRHFGQLIKLPLTYILGCKMKTRYLYTLEINPLSVVSFTVFIATLFTIARTWKLPRCPSRDE